jgi:hypothetical protein
LLIVEDAPTDRELYQRFLLKDPNCDYELLIAESVVEGLEFCETGLFGEYVRVIETGMPLVKEDLIYTDVFGGQRLTRAYDLRVSKLHDGLICAWRDITDLKRLELIRIAAEQDRDRFVNLFDRWQLS